MTLFYKNTLSLREITQMTLSSEQAEPCLACGGTGKVPDQGTTNRTGEGQDRAHTTKHGPAQDGQA